MNKKNLVIGAVALLLGWLLVKGLSSSLPKEFSFESTVFKRIQSQSRNGADIGHYTPVGEPNNQFSRMIILTRWDEKKMSVADFDARYVKALEAQGGVEGHDQAGANRHCIFIKSSPKPQLIFNEYFSKSGSQYQLSLTLLESDLAELDAAAACNENSRLSSGLSELSRKIL